MNGRTGRQRMVLASWLAVIGLAATAFLVRSPAIPSASGTTASALPAPTVDEPTTGQPKTETAVLAGGCFWGVQGVYQLSLIHISLRPMMSAPTPRPGNSTRWAIAAPSSPTTNSAAGRAAVPGHEPMPVPVAKTLTGEPYSIEAITLWSG